MMMGAGLGVLHFLSGVPHFSFPQNAVANEEIVLRSIHFLAGITWIGLLYFFNLVGAPTMKSLGPETRRAVYPALMSRAMAWFRWSALVTVLVGLRYYMILLGADAENAGHPGLLWTWLGEWFLVWMIAYAIVYALELPFEGLLGTGPIRAALIAVVVLAASWVILEMNQGPDSSNAHLAISVGGGLGLVMLMNVWAIVWRAQKRLIHAMRSSATEGTLLSAEAERLMRWSSIASRTAFWLSFPMLFFMAAAEHYPFLASLGR